MMKQLEIRRVRSPEDLPLVPEITKLLHSAYGELLRSGMRFVASHQSDEMTLRRLTQGVSLLGYLGSELIATVVLSKNDPEQRVPLYREDGLFIIGQFAVEPQHQRKGYGSALLEHAEQEVMRKGGERVALDTAENAHQLIDMYRKPGYKIVDHYNWDITNYSSVVMIKNLE